MSRETWMQLAAMAGAAIGGVAAALGEPIAASKITSASLFLLAATSLGK